MPRPILVLDLDGTLADTAPDLLDSLNHCLEHAGIGPADPLALRTYVGNGARVMIERAFEARRHRLDPPRLDELQAVFLQHYIANMPGKTALFPGARGLLDRASDGGFALAVCTNKMEAMSVRLLEGLGIAGIFSAICGADTFSFRKPDARHLTETIRLAGGDPDRAVMIGDSRTDIDTAKAAGIPVIAVDFGYSDRPVVEFDPSCVVSHFDEISLDLLSRLGAKGG